MKKTIGILSILLLGLWACKKEDDNTEQEILTSFVYDGTTYDVKNIFNYSYSEFNGMAELTIDLTDGTAKQLYGSGGDDYSFKMTMTFMADDDELLTPEGSDAPYTTYDHYLHGTSSFYDNLLKVELTLLNADTTMFADSSLIELGDRDNDHTWEEEWFEFYGGGNLWFNGIKISNDFKYKGGFSEIKLSDLN